MWRQTCFILHKLTEGGRGGDNEDNFILRGVSTDGNGRKQGKCGGVLKLPFKIADYRKNSVGMERLDEAKRMTKAVPVSVRSGKHVDISYVDGRVIQRLDDWKNSQIRKGHK